MASQTRTMPSARAQASRSPQGIIGQISTLLIQPRTFFRWMPQGRRWLMMAALVLLVFGFAATRQIKSSTSSSDTEETQGFDPATLQGFDPSALSSDSAAFTGRTGTTEQTSNTASSSLPFAASATTSSTTTEATDTNASLMSALMAACGMLALWGGQALLLCLIPLLGGHAPKIGPILQVAVWASLPLALMLILRQIYFMAGGTGGSLGLSLLLDEWAGYDSLPSGAQRLLAALTSNLTMFSLWSLVLLYCGARFALGGRRWSAALVVLIWMIAVPTVTSLMTDPATTVAPRITTETTTDSTSTSDDSSSSSAVEMSGMSGMSGIMGGMPSGGMPSGGMPGGMP